MDSDPRSRAVDGKHRPTIAPADFTCRNTANACSVDAVAQLQLLLERSRRKLPKPPAG